MIPTAEHYKAWWEDAVADRDRYREALERIASGDFIRRDAYDIAREALAAGSLETGSERLDWGDPE